MEVVLCGLTRCALLCPTIEEDTQPCLHGFEEQLLGFILCSWLEVLFLLFFVLSAMIFMACTRILSLMKAQRKQRIFITFSYYNVAFLPQHISIGGSIPISFWVGEGLGILSAFYTYTIFFTTKRFPNTLVMLII